MAKVPRIIKVPEGEAYVATENPLGEMGYYVVSKGDLVPFRVKIRSASFNNISIVPVGGPGRLRARPDHHPRQPLLHPGGHRPMTLVLAAFDPPYWLSTLIKVLVVGVARAHHRPDPRHGLPVQGHELDAEPPRSAGGRAPRQPAAARRRREVPPEGGHRPERRRPVRVQGGAARRADVHVPALRGPARRRRTWWSPTSTSASSSSWPCRRCRSSACSWPAGRSANKYSLMGGLRAAGQLIAYELPMVLAVVGVVIQAGTLSLNGIVFAQADGSIFGWDGIGQPVHPHPVRRVRHLPRRGAGRAHPAAVRHAGGRVRDRRRLPGRVLRLPVPDLLPGRVRHRLRVRRHRRRCCSSAAGRCRGSTPRATSTTCSARPSCSPR